jgi:hypothetical protein
LRPSGGQGGQVGITVAAVAAAFEEVVAVFVADGEEAELGEARIGVEHEAVGGSGQRFELVPHGEALGQAAAAVLDGGVSQARVGGEHLEILAGPGEHDFGLWEGLFGGVHQDAGHRDVRAQRHAGEHNHPGGCASDRARAADAIIAREVGSRNRLREQARINIAQGGLEAVAQALYENSKEGFGAGFFEQGSRKAPGRISGDTALQQRLREELTRSTSQ